MDLPPRLRLARSWLAKIAVDFWARIRPRLTYSTVAFWTIALIPFALENASSLTGFLGGKCHENAEEFGSVYAQVRHWLLQLDPYLRAPSDVVLVTYDTKNEGRYVMGNFCVQREFTAMVLDRVAKAGPSVIAIDWTNNTTSCPADDGGTKKLKDTVRRITSQGVPVVTARRTSPRDDVGDRTELVGREDALDGAGAEFGIIRLHDCEKDRLPLGWKYYPSAVTGGGEPPYMYSLSMETVLKANDEAAVKAPTLTRLMRHDDMPYISLYGLDDFTQVPASDLVCGHRLDASADFRKCGVDTANPAAAAKLRAKIVLLADIVSPDDIWSTPIGKLPGSVLQANYIEAVIGGNYMKPVHVLVQLLISLLLFLGIEYMFAVRTHEPLHALVVSLVLICAVIFLGYYLVERLLGYHVVLLLPSLTLIAIRVCYALGERHAAAALRVTHGMGSSNTAAAQHGKGSL